MITDRQLAYEAYRIRRMEEMLENAERKLAGLYREARRYNLSALLDMPSAADAAWERHVLLAKLDAPLPTPTVEELDAAERGDPYTLEGK